MTPISEMKAGREIDALVAERVMGWTRCRSPLQNRDDPDPRGWDNRKGVIASQLPYFSIDLPAAWMIVIRQIGTGTQRAIVNGRGKYFAWTCHGPAGKGTGKADTMPLAICRAALMAVGEK